MRIHELIVIEDSMSIVSSVYTWNITYPIVTPVLLSNWDFNILW